MFPLHVSAEHFKISTEALQTTSIQTNQNPGVSIISTSVTCSSNSKKNRNPHSDMLCRPYPQASQAHSTPAGESLRMTTFDRCRAFGFSAVMPRTFQTGLQKGCWQNMKIRAWTNMYQDKWVFRFLSSLWFLAHRWKKYLDTKAKQISSTTRLVDHCSPIE